MSRLPVQTSFQPGGFVTFDDKGAGCAIERIGVDLKQTMLILMENKRKGIKYLIGSKPDISCLAKFQAGLEMRFVCFAHDAVETIGGDK